LSVRNDKRQKEIMPSKDEVLKVARLSRLELNESELSKFQKQLENVLKLFEKVGNIDVEDILETSQVTGLENIVREDTVNCDKDFRPCDRDELLKNVPMREGNNIVVPQIIDAKK